MEAEPEAASELEAAGAPPRPYPSRSRPSQSRPSPPSSPTEPAGEDTVSEDELPEDLAAVAKGLDESEVASDQETAVVAGEGAERETEAAATSSLDEIEPGTGDQDGSRVRRGERRARGRQRLGSRLAVRGLRPGLADRRGRRCLGVPPGSRGLAIFDNSMYATSIMAGIGLLILGPVLLLIVWAVTFFTRETRAEGRCSFRRC